VFSALSASTAAGITMDTATEERCFSVRSVTKCAFELNVVERVGW
jgi:hypothetical protein